MVDPVTIGAVGAPIIGGILAGDAKAKGRKAAERELDNYLNELRANKLPELSAVEFEKFKDLFQAQEQAGTEFDAIEVDPRLKDAQMQALSALTEIGQDGLTLQARVNQEILQDQVARQDAGRQAAIMQNLAERGMGGAGMELAQRLASQQAASNRAGQAAMQNSANAQARALQALTQSGGLAGNIRSQDYGMQADRASAQDIINQFNTGNINQQRMNSQNIANMNTQVAQQQAQQGNQIAQQNFENRRAKLGDQSQARVSRAGMAQQAGAERGEMIGGIGNVVGQGLGTYAGG